MSNLWCTSDGRVTQDGLVAILEETLEEKIQPIRQTMDELKDAVNFINDKFGSFELRIGDLDDKSKVIQQENKFLKPEVLSKVTNDLTSELNDMEQYSRRDCVEITGLPMEDDEDTTDLAIKIGSLMDLDLNRSDISTSHRLPSKQRNQTYRLREGSSARATDPASKFPKVIIKFARRDTKEQFYKGRKHLHDKTTRDLGLSRLSVNRIYISESLSPRNKELFKDCLKFRKDHSFKFIWTYSGRMYLRKDSDSPARVITSKKDLEELSR